jgi:hypothetical protein
MTANGVAINYYGGVSNTGTVAYGEIEVSDDYGFITQIYNEDEI